ncbi:3276_t:CDS:1 [Paraglomus occultum]|uniref:3276_t:CDS:1 n=1 Tax=Paraglomus occultum TaxID=144539 RepID=A0A9N9D9P9_9GLOM|nr:3276_t:CDS:1 [Paraglomus occultum]
MSEPSNNYAGFYNAVEGFDSNQMGINLQAEPPTQTFRSHATSLPLHSNVHMNTMPYENIGSRMTLYPSVSYYGPLPDVDVSMNEQLNIPSRNQVETHRNSSCSLCGSSNEFFGTIKSQSIVHTFTQVRTQFNEPEYAIIREVRIQLVLGKVPTKASFGQVMALTQQ